jgi:GT2 family glycosyltransferase
LGSFSTFRNNSHSFISKEFNNPSTLFDSAYTIDWSIHKHNPVPLAEHGEYSGDIDVLTCRFTLCPIEFFQKVNFDDKRFPHYLSDYDLFLQAKYQGFRLILSYDSVIYDVGGVSGIEQTGRPLKLKELYTNMFSVRSHNNVVFMLRFFWKDCPNLWYKLKLTTLLFYYYLYLIAKATIYTLFGIDFKLPKRKK